MALTSKQRAALRSEAHHLDPVVHVGHHGVTNEVIQSLDEALRARELVKIQLGRNVDTSVKDAAAALATALEADVVQTIGKTATLYRRNPELEERGRKPRR